MANYKNTIYQVITGKQTLPLNVAGTGTISTDGKKVTGSGTAFKTEMPVGSWLVDLTQDEIRKVISVDSDTEAYIDVAFTSDLVGVAADYIQAKNAKSQAISVSIKSGLADGELDGDVLPNGANITFSKDSDANSSGKYLVDPIIVDGTGTTILSIVLK